MTVAKKTIFISFDYDNDKHYKNLLLAWDKNDDFDFGFYDGSLREAINSTNAAYIKSQIKPTILAASRLLCIVGEQTSKSAWIDWEIRRHYRKVRILQLHNGRERRLMCF